jgi:membrane associated rhomboid family serine protease
MLVPYNVDVPMERVPIANWLLIGVTALVSLFMFIRPHPEDHLSLEDRVILERAEDEDATKEDRDRARQVIERLAPPLALRWSPLMPVQLFTYQFVHGDILHLLGNMIFLFCFGNAVNAKLGQWQFLVSYLLLGALAGLAWLPFSHGRPLVGASGSIMGIVGLFVVLFPRNDVQIFYWFGLLWAGVTRISSMWVVLFFVACDLLGVVFSHRSPVAYVAHLAGAAGGFGLGIVLVRSRVVRSTRYEENLLEFLGYQRKEAPRRKKKRPAERRPAARTVAQLLANGSDFDICEGVFRRVLHRHGGEVDADGLREDERVVVLVWQAARIVNDGGFRALLEEGVAGDPNLQRTAAAYRAIGTQRAFGALRKALARFPGSRPSDDIDERLAQYAKKLAGLSATEDREFAEAGDEIEHCLAEYIRAHREFFLTLDDLPEQRVTERLPDRRTGDGRVDCGRLPHWGRVAFAARCARRVLPLFEESWPTAPGRHARAVEAAGELAEEAAADGRAPQGLKEAVIGARVAANAALDREDEAAPDDAQAGTIASLAAKVAEKAATAARTSAEGSAVVAQEAWDLTRKAAAAGNEALVRALKEDYARLRLAMARGQWTDRTVVSPAVFDVDWD